jgi:hypothetical protein
MYRLHKPQFNPWADRSQYTSDQFQVNSELQSIQALTATYKQGGVTLVDRSAVFAKHRLSISLSEVNASHHLEQKVCIP